MVMMNWDCDEVPELNRQERLARDLRTVLRLLWMMPLLEPKEIARITGSGENRQYRLLQTLGAEDLVVGESMGRGRGTRLRYWLTAKGARLVAAETGSPIPWQVTESGVGWLMRRLPMVEEFYALAPELMRHEGVLIDEAGHLYPDGTLESLGFEPTLRMAQFSWMRDGEIHAAVSYENGAWFPLVWVGSMVPGHQLREKCDMAVRQLAGRFKPSGWVIIGYDRLAAKLAAELWTSDNVLVTSTDGHIETKMRPGSFGFPLRETVKSERLGRPENLVNWWRSESRQYKPAMAALNSPLNYTLLRFIAEWCGPTPAHLEQRFGESYRPAVRALRKAGLVAKIDGAFYLDRLGELTVAQMDRVSHQTVTNRLDAYLNEDGLYRKNQERHNRRLIDVVLKLRRQDLAAYGGWRVRLTAPDGTQVVPDAAVLLEFDDVRCIAFLELEFTARSPRDMGRKRGPYLTLQRYAGKPIPQLWLLADPKTEERYRRSRRGSEPMLTVVLDDFLTGSSSRFDEHWRIDEDRTFIYELVLMLNQDDHPYLWED